MAYDFGSFVPLASKIASLTVSSGQSFRHFETQLRDVSSERPDSVRTVLASSQIPRGEAASFDLVLLLVSG